MSTWNDSSSRTAFLGSWSNTRLTRFRTSIVPPSRPRRLECREHGRGVAAPVFRFDAELRAAALRQRIELGPPVRVRRAPGRRDPPAFLEAVQRRIQRYLTHRQGI